MMRQRELQALTGIRGIAAWWIVLYHFNEYLVPLVGLRLGQLIGQGYLAVDLFFELSGFIIALNYADRFRTLRVGALVAFLGNRLARIYPLHIFILLLFLINPLAIALFSTDKVVGESYNIPYFLLSLFLAQNWGFTSSVAWNVPAWSISTEWLAYLVFPFSASILLCCVINRGRAILAMALLILILIVGFVILGRSIGEDIPQTGLFRCLIEFWLGMNLYLFWAMGPPGTGQSYAAIALAAAVFAIYATFAWPDFVLAPVGFLLVIYALTAERSLVSRVIAWRPVYLLGLVSYSTYLVHYFIRDWVKFLLVRDGIPTSIACVVFIAVTLTLSFILYWRVELPGRVAVRAWAERFAARRLETTSLHQAGVVPLVKETADALQVPRK
jgi:peptidoglycan/LPS O-acetylase OafA/YrhL